MDGLTVGRMVHYVLNEGDCEEINRRRVQGVGHGEGWPAGAQAHVGNPVRPGEHLAMVIVAVFGTGGVVNGKVLLDGNDSYWATSRAYSEEPKPFTWHWIERA